MFGILTNLAKTVVAVATVPGALVVDTAEAVGLKHDYGVNHTGRALEAVVQNLENAVDPTK